VRLHSAIENLPLHQCRLHLFQGAVLLVLVLQGEDLLLHAFIVCVCQGGSTR
jgi:hypothetical protein